MSYFMRLTWIHVHQSCTYKLSMKKFYNLGTWLNHWLLLRLYHRTQRDRTDNYPYPDGLKVNISNEYTLFSQSEISCMLLFGTASKIVWILFSLFH